MRKKFLILLVVVLLVVAMNPTTVFATNAIHRDVPYTATGVLTDDEGNNYNITGILVGTNQTNARGAETSATYRYDIPAEIMASGGSMTEYGNDSAYASTVYLTIHYLHTDEYPVEYLLQRVSGYWNVSASNTLVTSSKLSYACTSPGFDQNETVIMMPVSNNFNVATGYNQYVPENIPTAMVSAALDLEYAMGTSRKWSFRLQTTVVQQGVDFF
ncbi:MAG: hypothetical protein IJN72_08810 [Firmicutes bacterium]|nr:hypothetical protein [Bacillota bacterium]